MERLSHVELSFPFVCLPDVTRLAFPLNFWDSNFLPPLLQSIRWTGQRWILNRNAFWVQRFICFLNWALSSQLLSCWDWDGVLDEAMAWRLCLVAPMKKLIQSLISLFIFHFAFSPWMTLGCSQSSCAYWLLGKIQIVLCSSLCLCSCSLTFVSTGKPLCIQEHDAHLSSYVLLDQRSVGKADKNLNFHHVS